MNTISLHNVLPAVFANQRDGRQSDIWLCEQKLQKGETILIEAESGKGKSSLAAFLHGYRNDYEGVIEFDGTDIRQFSQKQWNEIRRKNISMVFQELRLFGELTALDNVQINNRNGYLKREETERLFAALGIAEKMNVRAEKLSFGQQQRVALIRALAQPFDILIADEPISHIDDLNAQTMGEIMMAECRKREAALLITSIGKHIPLPYDRVLRL